MYSFILKSNPAPATNRIARARAQYRIIPMPRAPDFSHMQHITTHIKHSKNQEL